MSEKEQAHRWAEELKNGGIKELRRLAARHESLKQAAAGAAGAVSDGVDTLEKPDTIKED